MFGVSLQDTQIYYTLTNFRYIMMCKVYADVGGIK